MKDAAIRLERGGADFVLICSNTMHRMADAVARAIHIPLIPSLIRPGEDQGRGLRRVGLIGTAFTMEHDFCKGRLNDLFGLEVVVPQAEDRHTVHDIIYRELVAGGVLKIPRPIARSSLVWSRKARRPSSSAAPRSCCDLG